MLIDNNISLLQEVHLSLTLVDHFPPCYRRKGGGSQMRVYKRRDEQKDGIKTEQKTHKSQLL